MWAAYALAFALSEFGVLIGVPDWLISRSPFNHLLGLAGLAAVAVGLGAAGALGFRRRDVAA